MVVSVGDPEAFEDLDPGESATLSAAAEAAAAVLVDERKARVLIASDPSLRARIPHVTGIIGLLLLAKRTGRIATIQPLLDRLIEQNFWISTTFYHEILALAGEE